MLKKKTVFAVQQPPARGVALLGLMLAVLGATHLEAQSSFTYAVGTAPRGIVSDGTNVWVANSGSNTVTKLLASTGATVGTYPVGTMPQGMAFDGANIWVANQGSGNVTELLASTGATVATYFLGGTPQGVAFDGSRIWVTDAEYTVTALLASTGAIASYSVGISHRGAGFDGIAVGGNAVWIANGSSNTVTKMQEFGQVVAAYPVGNAPTGVIFDGTNVWVANLFSNTVTKLLASNGVEMGTYPAGASPWGVAFDGTNIWVTNSGVNTVTKLLASTGATLGTYSVGSTPEGIVSDGTNVWVTNVGSNTVTKISPTASQATAALSATSLAFRNQAVGLTTAPQSVTVTNSGISALNITSIAITGTNSADFAQTNTCGSSVAAGRSCVISATFTPTAIGTRTASISVTDNASNSPQTISLTGAGGAGYTTVDYPVGGFPAGWPSGASSEPKGVVFDGTNIWVANFGSNNVTKLLASTGAIVGTYSVGANNYPVGLAFDGTNIWVTNQGSNTVTKLLASTGAIVGIYPVGSEPEGIAFDGTNIWVANYGSAFVPPGTNDVTKLRASTGATVGTYGAAAYPAGVAFDGTNIWVTSKQQSTVTKLVASTGIELGDFYVGTDPEGVVFDGVNIWVANNGSNTVTKLLASTGALVGTYPVGSKPQGIAFDGTNIWVANSGSSTVTQLASTGTPVGTYPVGSQPSGVVLPDSSDVANPESVAFDGTNIWVTNFYSGTVTKISPVSQAPSISPGGIVPLDSTASTIRPGEWVSIWGRNLASGTTAWSGNFPTSLGGTSVRINGKAAYLSFVSPGQINLQAPDDTATGAVPVVVTTANGSATSTVTLGEFAPSFALLDTTHIAGIIPRSDGSGAYGGGTYDILGPTGGSLGYPTVAAKAGDSVELYGVGFGPTNPSVPAGQAFSGAAATTNTVQLAIRGKTVLPSFSGLSEAGLFQINVTIPAGLGTGDLPLIGNVAGVQTQPGVVISLQ